MSDCDESETDPPLAEGNTHRILVRWYDERTGSLQFLGQLSDSPPETGTLFFRFRYERIEKTLLAFFELRFKINPASKGVRSLYLVIPAQDMEVTVTNPMSDATEHDPRAVREFQKAGMDSSTKTIRLLFSLKELGCVTMPLQGFKKPMSTKSKGLLLSLMSLARAMKFEIYFPSCYLDENLVKILQECSEGLREGRLKIPAVDYDDSYHGRAWGRNQWGVYHLEADEALPTTWNPLIDDCPPPYEEVVRTTMQSRHKATGLTSGLQSVHSEPGTGETIPGERVDPPASRSMTVPPSISPDPGSTRLPNATKGHYDGLGRKRKAEQVPLGSRYGRQAGQQDATHPKKRKTGEKSTQESAGELSPPASQRTSPYPQSASISRSSVMDGGPNRRFFDDVQYYYFSNAAAWLKAAWDVQPDVHEVFLPELGMLAQAARERDLGRYDQVRINCMYMLCRRERVSGSSGPFSNEFAVDDQVWYIFNFVYREIGPGSDILILDELIALSEVAHVWKQVNRLERSDEWQHWKLMFTTQMAVCILVALYRGERDWFRSVTAV